MPDLVCQSQLRHFGWHSAVVIHESDDAGVQRALGRLIHAAHGLGVGLVLLADTAGRARRGRDPGEPKGAAGEVPVDEDMRYFASRIRHCSITLQDKILSEQRIAQNNNTESRHAEK